MSLIVVSSDGQEFQVEKDDVAGSDLLRGYLEDFKDRDIEKIEIPTIEKDILKDVLEYLAGNELALDDLETIFETFYAASYMGITSLLQLCCQKISEIMNEKNLKVLRDKNPIFKDTNFIGQILDLNKNFCANEEISAKLGEISENYQTDVSIESLIKYGCNRTLKAKKEKFRLIHFWLACGYGNLDAAKLIITRAGLKKEDVKSAHNRAFGISCINGRLEMAQWLHKKFNITKKEASDSLAFSRSCEAGYLEIAQWLYKTFNITKEEAMGDDNYAFNESCANGHLETAKWLHKKFNITREDIVSDNNYIFRKSCENGYLEIAQWLYRTFDLTREDAMSDGNYAFVKSCENDHLETAEWLHGTFDITKEEAMIDDNYIFEKSRENGDSEIAQWLYETFDLTREDVMGG